MLMYSFNKGNSEFFTTLKERIKHYFAERNLYSVGNFGLIVKSVVLILTAAGLYGTLVFITPVAWVSVLLCVLLGLNLALIGFNVMHDGGHQSFSRYAWVNTVAAHILNVLGGNAYFWKIKHNINHHTYTNIEGMDSDIDVKPFMRLHEGQPLRPYHRFQHLYWVILYGISYVVWVFYEDFQKYFSGRVSENSRPKKLPASQHIIFWGTKLYYVVLYMALPIYWVGWWPWLVGFSIVTSVCGLAISIVFQLAHVVNGPKFHSADKNHEKYDWAIHQVRSTANFANQSKLLHYTLGGLNFQIEHHLFPKVSHIHYPAIAKFVKQTCQEFGIAYIEYRSMLSAILSHIAHLYKMGRATA